MSYPKLLEASLYALERELGFLPAHHRARTLVYRAFQQYRNGSYIRCDRTIAQARNMVAREHESRR